MYTINNIIVDDQKTVYPVPYVSSKQLIEKEVDFFGEDIAAPCYFDSKATDIPLINFENIKSARFAPVPDTLSFSYPEEGKAVITKDFAGRTSTVTVDTKERTIVFSDYDHYAQINEKTFLDQASIGFYDYLEIFQSVNSYGQEKVLDYSSYGDLIKVYKKRDSGTVFLIPLQMVTDIFGDTVDADWFLIYNGEKIFFSDYIVDDAFYYTEKKLRSEALAEFTYNELCLNLDFHYGLKKIHGINDFDSYFASIGLKSRLLDKDPVVFSKAINELCDAYLSDRHSLLIRPSSYVGLENKDQIKNPPELFLPGDVYYEQAAPYKNARAEIYGASVPGLEFLDEGKTAVVRFDKFTCSNSRNVEEQIGIIENNHNKSRADLKNIIKTDINSADFKDYITTDVFIVLVNELINEKGSVENVVLDMSCNVGGENTTGVLTLSWLLGKAQLNVTDSVTDAKTSMVYRCDLNGDGKFGEEDVDCLKDKNLFCLISPASFSCGNMVPAVLKASNRCTILGETSGGGTSCYYSTSAADSTLFWVSSRWVMTVNKNGSNYDIDRGVEPHERLLPNQMFDMDVLTKIINKKLNPAL